MFAVRTFTPRWQQSHGSQRRFALLLIGLMLLTLGLPLVQPQPISREMSPPVSPTAPDLPVPQRTLPQELQGKPEVVELRTADSATFDMGNGKYGVMQDSAPLHYKDADGAWQPINPAFAATPDGWVNSTNALKTSLDRASSQAKIYAAGVGMTWQPFELALANSNGTQTIATPLSDRDAAPAVRSSDGRTVRYAASWSDRTIEDQWHVNRGSSEYAMRLEHLPVTDGTAPDSLDLRVYLHLLPGTTIHVNGERASLPLETAAPLEFVGADGAMMLLRPPRTYQHNDSETAVNGSYLLRGTTDPTVLELRVRTPWAWLADSARQFPVVIDPLFQVRGPTSAYTAYFPNSTKAFGEYRNFSNTRLEVGSFNDGVQQLLVYFNLPTMPAGTQVLEAHLSATPVDHNFLGEHEYARENLLAYDINTIDPTTDGPNYPAATPLPPGPQPIFVSRGWKIQFPINWNITNLVQQWALDWNGGFGTPPSPGVLLRTERQFCKECAGFYFDNPSTWDDSDLFTTNYISNPGSPYGPYTLSDGSGIRLLVFYQGPTLVKGQRIDMQPNFGAGGDPSPDPPYYHAEHEYRIASNLRDGNWSAVAVRGFAPTVNTPNPPENTIASQRDLNGALSLQVRSNDDQSKQADGAVDAARVGYVLFNGQNPSLEAQPRVKVGFTTTNPSNGYDVQLVDQNATLTNPALPGNIAGGNTATLNYYFSSYDALALWSLNLPGGSNSRVDIKVSNGSLYTHAYDYFAKYFSADLYPQSAGAMLTPRSDHLAVNSNVNPTTPNASVTNAFLTSSIFAVPAATNYGLALSYNGPALQINDIIPGPARFSPQAPDVVKTLQFTVVVRITSCQTVGPTGFPLFPTAAGTCQEVKCPAVTTPFRSSYGMGLWNDAGWSAPTPPFNNTAPGSAPLIGPDSTSAASTVAIVGGKVGDDGTQVNITGDGSPTATALLIACPAPAATPQPPTDYFSVYDGRMRGFNFFGALLVPEPTGSGAFKFDPWHVNDKPDLSSLIQYILPTQGTANGAATLVRHTGNDLFFYARWGVDVSGMASLETYTSITKSGAEQPPDVASLILRLGSTFALQISPAGSTKDSARSFEAIRFGATGDASVTQQPKLGGASKPIQGLISPRGRALADLPSKVDANGSIIDLRDPSNLFNRTWAMPDVHTKLTPGVVAFSTPGTLQVYSTDHPSATDDISQEFSYDTFGASVSIKEEACDEGGPKVTVIRGETRIALPNMGDSADPNNVIAASFKLCAGSLRQVHMEFKSAMGVPIGNSGLFLTGLSGTVNIYDDHTTLIFGIDFQAAQGGDGGVVKMHGEITIDTRGLFAFKGQGTVLSGLIKADGKLWVAWNPLDTGFEAELSYAGWFKGFARAHIWEGQGWQHRYAWLPDNNDKHLAAQIGATITIESGAIIDWAFIEVPPDDVDISIEVAFGQFCTNDSCTDYEWGIKGKFEILGYNVGLYYGFDHGLDLILGNDGHVLIDQYGGAQTSPILLDGKQVQPRKAAPVIDGVATETFEVTPQTEQVLVGLGWRAGAPNLTLIAPDGTRLDTAAAQTTYTTVISDTGMQTLLTLQRPASGAWAGTWRAEISNLSADPFFENYQLVALMNKGAPAVDSEYRFLTPTVSDDGTDSYLLSWYVPPDTGVNAPDSTISLFSTRIPTTTGVLGYRVPIRYNLPFKDGKYVWDTRGLESGTYQIYAQVDDGVNQLNTASIADPADTCTPLTTGLPHASAFDPIRFPGTVEFTSTGTLNIADVTPPPVPTGLKLDSIDGALIASWDAPPAADRDTAAYAVRWTQTTPQGPIDNQQRLTANLSPTLRLVGLSNDISATVELSAIDASGNTSAVISGTATPSGTTDPVPFQPQNLVATSVTATNATLTWDPNPEGPPAASYQVLVTNVVSGTTTELNVPGPSATITGLQPGQVYDVDVRASNSAGWHSVAVSPTLRLVATNGVDSDGDGLPDDWAAAYGVSAGAADSDGDGLTNAEEFAAGSNPSLDNTDGDDFSDYEEVKQADPLHNTDPLDANSYPAEQLQPRLELSDHRLTFRAIYGPETTPPIQLVGWSNVGGGSLKLQPTPSVSWLEADVAGANLVISADPSGLKPGFYSGVVRVGAAPNSDPLIGGPQCVRVNLWVALPIGGIKTYLPLLLANKPVPPPAPDLVGSFTLSPHKTSFTAGEPVQITAVVTNTGNGAAGAFWTDFYINPSAPPHAPNQAWYEHCGMTPCFGIAWYVPGGLAAGQSITLTSTLASYSAGHTIWPGWFASGTSDLYMYVDVWHPGDPLGGVAESDETNNRTEQHGLVVTGTNPPTAALEERLKALGSRR